MHKLMKTLALLAMVITTLIGVAAAPASGQAATTGCPPSMPPGRPPGTPPGNPPGQTNRPQYPVGRCQLALSQSAAQRGDTVSATGNGFAPGETVTFSIAGKPAGSAVANDEGVASASLRVPANAAVGQTEVVASAGSGSLSAAFEVLGDNAAAAPETGGSTLPRTGVEVAGLAIFGLLLIGIGAAAVAGARRKRTISAA
jgi:LPXTG-motif cell wall-anchored protein